VRDEGLQGAFRANGAMPAILPPSIGTTAPVTN
jgi:hypothetical protein